MGRIGGKQHISLPHYCRTTLGTPVHEILHALGFYHEQSRPDRDKYIEVEWKNIKSRAKGNFEEHEQQGTFISTLLDRGGGGWVSEVYSFAVRGDFLCGFSYKKSPNLYLGTR